MCTEDDGEAAAKRDSIGHERGRDLVQLYPAILFRHIHSQQSKLASLAHQSAAYLEVLSFDLRNLSGDPIFGKLLRCFRYLALLQREILWREYVSGSQILNEETAS